MKRKFLIVAAIVAGLAITSCSVDTEGLEDLQNQIEEAADEAEAALDEATEEANEAAEEMTSNIMYQCPDSCQNGPAYNDPGNCEGCGKEMVEI